MEDHMKSDKQTILLNRVIFVLSLAGILMAAYVLQGWMRHSSIICLTGGGCTSVQKSSLSYPFGIPVPAIGLVGYTIIFILSFLRTASSNKNLLKGILGMATFGICFVSWFTYTEIFLIHGICMWCAISAVNMFVIFGLTIASLRLQKQ
jgi:uncharacterized membrane protein